MAYLFPSAQWLQALKEKLNSDEQYAHIARNWEGDMMFDIKPDGLLKEPMKLYLDLWHGTCRQAKVIEPGEENDIQPAFTLIASYSNLALIMKSELDPLQAMVTRKLKVQGSMAYMMRNVPVVLQFVRCAQEIDTKFL